MPRFRALLFSATLVALAACDRAPRVLPAPPAEFLVVTADSSYWVTSEAGRLHMRGVPMLLARVGGRFSELYVADDDRSFFNAVFVGQRLYARDLVRGDSTELFSDGVVSRLARAYAKANPHETPLGEDEPESDHPGTTATAELEVLNVDGPYVSYECRTNVDVTDAGHTPTDAHAARRGVLDLRTGEAVTLDQLFGAAAANAVVVQGTARWDTMRDSLHLLDRNGQAFQLRALLRKYAFDATSFSLDAKAREPRVIFAVPGERTGGPGRAVMLPALSVTPAPPWWRDIVSELPLGADSLLRWPHGQLTVLAHGAGTSSRLKADRPKGDHRAAPDHMRIALRDSAGHEWPLGVITAPVRRVLWLSAIDAESRHALRKAFNEAATYSGETQLARGLHGGTVRMVPVARSSDRPRLHHHHAPRHAAARPVSRS